MATTAAQMASYLYPEEEDPEGAFSWWLSPCGGTTLVPDEIKKLFGILSSVTGGVSSFKTPKNLPKGSGKKGDGANPHDQGTPRAPSKGNGNNTPKCKIPASQQTQRLRHTLRERACVADKTVQTEWIVTSLNYAANAAPTRVSKPCSVDWDNACWHYSSAIRQNPGWATLTCVPEAAATKKPDKEFQGYGKHNTKAKAGGMRVRLTIWNGNAAKGLWKGVCFQELVSESAMSNRDLKNKVDAAGPNLRVTNSASGDKRLTQRSALVDVSLRPEFSISSWPPSAPNDGLNQNPCWPRNIAPQDPGFTLFENDPYYRTHPSPYNYRADYDPPTNGA
ncbi:hypothetical protein HYFRA_00006244 [Hymenoscyphus fraxineus]|uniref:Uncharacterized protein n=1 Tax=Hymenoscyphus fraxineus TaxID=746836 RepID=A0A9N9L9S9_9HELO|nr:hypothetical protein HYFRA_00006244 [Hymenoscyphus fraxineus]